MPAPQYSVPRHSVHFPGGFTACLAYYPSRQWVFISPIFTYEKLQSYSFWFSAQTICSPRRSAPLQKRGRVCIVSNERAFVLFHDTAVSGLAASDVRDKYRISWFNVWDRRKLWRLFFFSPFSHQLSCVLVCFFWCTTMRITSRMKGTHNCWLLFRLQRDKSCCFFLPSLSPHPRRRHRLDPPYLSGLINYYRLHFIWAES